MKLEIAELLVDANPNLELHEEYSGRGMYGSTTAGVVGSLKDLITAIAIAAPMAEYHDEFVDEVSTIKIDNMGMDYIFY